MSPKSSLNVAGQAIAAGGFGCVFYPAIKCKGADYRTSGVSKLMFTRDAKEEYKELTKIKPILEKIPNENQYFILTGITLCDPGPLDAEDMKNLDKKCLLLRNNNINSKNINSQLKKFKILNIPFGGDDLDKIFYGDELNVKQVLTINHKLIDILINAIIPMNKLGLYHNDIKANNILFNLQNKEIRIIDWGLAGVTTKSRPIPKVLINRPFQYNIPLTIILFNKNFKIFYASELGKLSNATKPNLSELKDIIFNFINKNKINNIGHYQYIIKRIIPTAFYSNELRQILLNKTPDNLKYGGAVNIILEYIATVLLEYTDFKNRRFLENKYFLEVYSKNVDVWGFITIFMEYISISESEWFERIFKSLPNDTDKQFLNLISQILYKYLFNSSYAAKPINIELLINNLLELNVILGEKKLTIKEATKEATKEVTKEATKEATKEPTKEPTKESTKEPTIAENKAIDTALLEPQSNTKPLEQIINK